MLPNRDSTLDNDGEQYKSAGSHPKCMAAPSNQTSVVYSALHSPTAHHRGKMWTKATTRYILVASIIFLIGLALPWSRGRVDVSNDATMTASEVTGAQLKISIESRVDVRPLPIDEGYPRCDVQWTEPAERHFIRKLQELQHPASCGAQKKMLVMMDVSGLLWNFQAFVRALALGLQLNRTVIPVARPAGGPHWQHATFDGCDPNRHLGCYFPNITSCSPDANVTDAEFWHWDFFCQGECSAKRLASIHHQDTIYLSQFDGGYPGWAPDVYSKEAWEAMTASPCTFLKNCNASNIMDLMYSKSGIFMLHAIITKWMFDYTNRPTNVEHAILAANAGWKKPVAAVHIRRTDKMAEDPYWNTSKTYRSTLDYVMAVEDAGPAGRPWGSVFLMTDSEGAVVEFKKILSGRGNTSVMYNSLENRTVIESGGGHVHIPPDMKYDMQLQFISTISLVRSVSEFAVGTLSSNVFRVLVQLLGAEGRCAQINATGPLATSFDSSENTEGWAG